MAQTLKSCSASKNSPRRRQGFFKVSQQGSKPASQANEKITQESPATEQGKNLTSDGDAGDEAGGFSTGDGVVPNQNTSDKAVPKTKGDKPKAKTQPPQRTLVLAPSQAQTGPGSQSSRPVDPPGDVPGIKSVPKAKPKPKAPGRARPQSVDPKQTRLTFK